MTSSDATYIRNYTWKTTNQTDLVKRKRSILRTMKSIRCRRRYYDKISRTNDPTGAPCMRACWPKMMVRQVYMELISNLKRWCNRASVPCLDKWVHVNIVLFKWAPRLVLSMNTFATSITQWSLMFYFYHLISNTTAKYLVLVWTRLPLCIFLLVWYMVVLWK